jgi:hypothetical protein
MQHHLRASSFTVIEQTIGCEYITSLNELALIIYCATATTDVID